MYLDRMKQQSEKRRKHKQERGKKKKRKNKNKKKSAQKKWTTYPGLPVLGANTPLVRSAKVRAKASRTVSS